LSLANRLHPLEPWEISIVVSATGTVPHLIETSELTARTPHTLCGVNATKLTRASFAARGCLRCCHVALGAGLKIVVVGAGAQLIDLTEVRQTCRPVGER
jgi:hypothetical protein